MDQFFNLLPQALVNGVIAGSLYSLIALGLNLIFGILKFVNFAHGDMAMLGAYIFFVAVSWWSLPVWGAVFVMLVGIVVASLIIERFTFRKVRKAPTLIPLIISVGVSFFLQNLILLVFEAKSRSYTADISGIPFFDGAIYVTEVHIWIIVVNILLTLGLFLFLKRSKIGKAIRAVADNQEIAQILGINVNRVVMSIFAIAGMLAGVAGVLAAYDQTFNPFFGVHFGIKAFAAVILGGVGSLPGAVLGGMVIGVAENVLLLDVGFISIPSAYKDAIAFTILILMLYVKPTGLLGAKREEVIRK